MARPSVGKSKGHAKRGLNRFLFLDLSDQEASIPLHSPRCRYSFILRLSYRCFWAFFGWLSVLGNGCFGLRTASVITSNDLVIRVLPCSVRFAVPEDFHIGPDKIARWKQMTGIGCFKHFNYKTSQSKVHSKKKAARKPGGRGG